MKTTRFDVEWTTNVPIVDGDIDPYRSTGPVRSFDTEAEATAFAKTKIDDDYWGCPRIYEMRYVTKDFDDGGPIVREWDRVRSIEID